MAKVGPPMVNMEPLLVNLVSNGQLRVSDCQLEAKNSHPKRSKCQVLVLDQGPQKNQ